MIRSIIFACLTALIATVVARAAVAEPVANTPADQPISLAWTNDGESLPAVLQDAFHTLAEKDPSSLADGSALTRASGGFRLHDDSLDLTCLAQTLGFAQVVSYRCDFNRSSYSLDWNNDPRSAAQVLFNSLDALNRAQRSGRTLSVLVHQGVQRVRVVDPSSWSRIACEKVIAEDLALAPSGSVRCQIDIRP